MRIVFFGTPEFAVPFLKAFLNDPDFHVTAVVTQPDKPSGRGHALASPPVKQVALEAGISVLQPATLKSTEAADALRAYQADAFVVVAYGKLIPKVILDIPTFGCLNVHPSLLPKYRGPSPMPWAIAEGDAQTGVTIMLLDEGMDTGPVLSQQVIALAPDETVTTLTTKIHAIGPALLISTLKQLAAGALKPISQDHNQATTTKLLTRDDGRIDWQAPADVIERRVRAYQPWPGTWTTWQRNGKAIRLKILKTAVSDASLLPSLVSIKEGRLLIGTLDRALEILELQPEGGAPMNAAAFVRGYSDINGAALG